MKPLKYLSNFWRTLEMLLFNCETNFTVNWFASWVNHLMPLQIKQTITKTGTKLCVPVVNILP